MSFWEVQCRMDWDIYHDAIRIKLYVVKEKITEQQYTEITGELAE